MVDIGFIASLSMVLVYLNFLIRTALIWTVLLTLIPSVVEGSREASPLRSKQGPGGFGFIVRRSKGLMLQTLTLVEIRVILYLTFALTTKLL